MVKYSTSIVKDAVTMYFKINSLRKVSSILNIPKSTISLWVSQIGKRFADSRKGCKHPNRKKTSRIFILPMVKKTLSENPYLTVTEVHLQLVNKHKIYCSYSTVLRAKNDLGLSRKRAPKLWIPPTKDIEKRNTKLKEFVNTVSNISMSDILSVDETSGRWPEILSVDETSFDSRITPLFGYCTKGERLVPFHHSEGAGVAGRALLGPTNRSRLSVISGVATEGLKGHRVIKGNANKSEFKNFLLDTLPKCKDKKYVLMDNVAFHKCEDVLRIIEEAGKVPLFVPPYSPMFNPEDFKLYIMAWEEVAPHDWTKTFVRCLRRNVRRSFNNLLRENMDKESV